MADKTITVGLLWHTYNSGNLGVSALTAGNLSIVDAEICLAGMKAKYIVFGPRGDRSFTAPDNLPSAEFVELSASILKPKNWALVAGKIRQCDLIFDIGGGDSFSDIYGWKRFLKVCLSKLLLDPAGNKLIVSPQTIGPFKSIVAEKLAIFAMKRSLGVFARDQLSFERTKNVVPKRLLHLTTDVAFCLPYYDELPAGYPELDPAMIHVGINISGLLYNGGYTGNNQFGLMVDYKKLTTEIIEFFARRPDVQVWLVPHVYRISTPSKEGDRDISLQIAEHYENVRVAPLFYNAVEAKTFISKMSFFVGARMHSTIAAVSSGVACVPLSYSIKFQGLFNSLGYSCVVDLKSAGTADCFDMVVSSYENRQELAERAQLAKDRADSTLESYRRFVREQLLRL